MFEDNLRTLIDQSELSKVEIAKRMDVSPGAISQWLNGSTVPNVKVGIKLAKLFGISCEELVYGSLAKKRE